MLLLFECLREEQSFNKFERKFFRKSQKAFSVIEAFITLIIVGLALGASAPLISKQINNSQMSGLQLQQINKRLDNLEKSISALKDSVIPSKTVAFFYLDECPDGWSLVSNNWQGRFPRFSGSYTISAYGTTLEQDASLDVGEIQDDAIRNITGVIPTNIRDQYANNMPEGAFVFSESRGYFFGWPDGLYWGWKINYDTSRVVPTASENRPMSVALLGCIKD